MQRDFHPHVMLPSIDTRLSQVGLRMHVSKLQVDAHLCPPSHTLYLRILSLLCIDVRTCVGLSPVCAPFLSHLPFFDLYPLYQDCDPSLMQICFCLRMGPPIAVVGPAIACAGTAITGGASFSLLYFLIINDVFNYLCSAQL